MSYFENMGRETRCWYVISVDIWYIATQVHGHATKSPKIERDLLRTPGGLVFFRSSKAWPSQVVHFCKARYSANPVASSSFVANCYGTDILVFRQGASCHQSGIQYTPRTAERLLGVSVCVYCLCACTSAHGMHLNTSVRLFKTHRELANTWWPT